MLIGPYTMLPCFSKIFKADSLSSLQIDCGTLVTLNFEHVTDEDEQDGWTGGTMTGGWPEIVAMIDLPERKSCNVYCVQSKVFFF